MGGGPLAREQELAEGLHAFQVERDATGGRLGALLLGNVLDHGPHVDRLAPHTQHTRQREIIRHHTVHASELDFDGGKGFCYRSAGCKFFLKALDIQGQGLQRMADCR
jgi:hypothetical protein